ncbi:MAG: hypothetical protein Q4P06_00265 [Actinomycetaceae bacterium]|nr:hypothetical protein [Actinomycetaceae bacterium]
MPGIPDFVSQRGAVFIAVFLTLVVFSRSQATYWIARLATSGFIQGSEHSSHPVVKRVRLWLEGASVQRGIDAVERWGLFIIPLSFLTIGFQTVVHAGSGVLRLRWPTYTLCAVPGYLAWALMYTAIFMAAFRTGQALLLGKTWAFAVCTGLVVALGIFILSRRNKAAQESTLTALN